MPAKMTVVPVESLQIGDVFLHGSAHEKPQMENWIWDIQIGDRWVGIELMDDSEIRYPRGSTVLRVEY